MNIQQANKILEELLKIRERDPLIIDPELIEFFLKEIQNMPTPNKIRSERQKIERRIKDNERELAIIKADLTYLQSICEHPTPREWTKTCYDGSTDHYWVCDDCGKMECQ